QKQELPTLQVPPSIALKARSRQSQLHNNYSNDRGNNFANNSFDEEEPEEEFRTLLYPSEPWGRASRSRATAIIPSRRLISSLIEDIRLATDSQDSTDTSRHRRNRRVNNTRRVALLKRPRSSSTTSDNNATESSDDGDSASTFNTRKSTTSSAKKRPAKQQRPGQQSLSGVLNMANTTTSATRTHRTSKEQTLPRKPPRPRYTETLPEIENEHVEVVAVGDEEEDEEDVVIVDEEVETAAVSNIGDETSESDYSPGRRTMSQRQRKQERKARSRKLNPLQDDEDENQAIEQDQEPEDVLLELNRTDEMPKRKGSYRVIERMDCVVIPVVELSEKSATARPNRENTQLPRKAITGKFMKKDINLETRTRPGNTNVTTLTIQSPIKVMTANVTRPDSRRITDVVPVTDIGILAPRQTRSGARIDTTPNQEPTKTATLAYGQDPSHGRRGSLRQEPIDVEPLSSPSSVAVQSKVLHGWWLKRKDTRVQEDNLGILVQGNVLEPKAMTWQTSTIKDAPEPTLVMTFTGSFYRLSGSINAEKMESNGT
ncbi:hypothetical protein BGZ96_003818, partial [Linnemannia gamsii]